MTQETYEAVMRVFLVILVGGSSLFTMIFFGWLVYVVTKMLKEEGNE